MKNNSPSSFIQCVCGNIKAADMGLCDAHNHLWISRVVGVGENLPVLDNESIQLEELKEYRSAGGGSQIDCQPCGAGRDAHHLAWLSENSGVNIVTSTGFHLTKYYPPDYWLFDTTETKAADFFIAELTKSVLETTNDERPVKAGFIKIACCANFAKMSQPLLQAVASAAREVGCAVEMHTERGAQAELFVRYFLRNGMAPHRLIVCHVDKRTDFGLHVELAKTGVLLEYDTFFRPQYDPEQNVWPLLQKMLAAGFEDQLVLATDMAESSLWKNYAGGPGLVGLLERIKPRLESICGRGSSTITKLLGKNVARTLAAFAN